MILLEDLACMHASKTFNGESYEFSVSEAQPMENLKAAVLFILLSVVCGWLGFAIGGLLGSIFIGIGLNWFVVGVIFALAEREVSTEGFLAGFFFGILGSVIWLLLSLSREKTSYPPEYRS